ncbi:amidohydrolase family protein [Haliea sp. E1-2-M8]|uniref:metal-dependent hydrolase family protein n=1 Tax=Haliea sp. E1-2-M8 TaxID=3064706 RepID=UPI00272709AE|nr:amidohydrolase family protein [Haliea sp. E1-2-M8]MDO8863795.1 amidohydrolase family protein [Haliea sp. E1-2-M8]
MPVLFKNVSIFDGSGSALFPGEVMVEGQRITAVAKGSGKIKGEGAEVIDGKGATLMPGMCEAHAHITYPNMATLDELAAVPPEEHVFVCMHNAHKMLDAGFTSLYSAASSKIRTEVVVRNEINAGRIKGPRFRAASPEFVSTGGLGDGRQLHWDKQGIEIVADGVDDITRKVRLCIREGVDTIKVNISGDNFVHAGQDGVCTYSEAEVRAASEEAHERGVWLSTHCRADKAVRLALKYDFKVLYHCELIRDETLDLLAKKSDKIFLAPAIGANYRLAYHGEPWGFTPEVVEKMDAKRTVEMTVKTYEKIRKHGGIRVLPGGDYGFAWNPIGTNARDLELFVTLLGYTPAETLSAATKLGGEIMEIPDLGLVKKGFLADLLLVNGDPLKDITILQNKDNLMMVMKDGEFWKKPGQPHVNK